MCAAAALGTATVLLLLVVRRRPAARGRGRCGGPDSPAPAPSKEKPVALLPPDTSLPDPAVIVLIGAAGSGKSTFATTRWGSTQVLCLDQYRALVADSAGDRAATGDAVVLLQRVVLEARLRRGLTCVIDATGTEAKFRAQYVQAARRHDVPAVALLMPMPLEECLARNAARPDERRVPEDVVRVQHRAATDARPYLSREGFDHLVAGPGHRLGSGGWPCPGRRQQMSTTSGSRTGMEEPSGT
ncbi:AAA family ATPase [Streptomyces lavendofoliae]|uniref:AAA family ATPase n=1 Tax=Streptomyces lavendofoliae TaxID=67314 RepID=UPI00300E9B1D